MVREILLLGDSRLYEKSVPVQPGEDVAEIQGDLHDTLMAFRAKHHRGRAIAAPQIGIKKRIIYMYIDKPVLFVNPELRFTGDDQMEILDDCMSFPGLLVRVMRYRNAAITYYDDHWQAQTMILQDDRSELLQHEYDHLDGILATMRAMDNKSFFLSPGQRADNKNRILGII